LTLCAFDLLEFDGEDLRRIPIERRKAAFKGLLRRAHSEVGFAWFPVQRSKGADQ
jgi:ATP-dependent DNA ligase